MFVLILMLLVGTHLAWKYVVVILLFSINSSFASVTPHVLEESEVSPNKLTVKLKDAYESLLSFFRPVTCHHKGGETLILCHAGEGLNTTECLKNKCCPSKTGHELKCYMPFQDNVQMAVRLVVLAVGGYLILVCLPFCCCACLQGSQCPLRRANEEVGRRANEEVVWKKGAHGEDSYVILRD